MESILKWIYANEQMIYILVLVIFLGFIANENHILIEWMAYFAIFLSTINVVGGFVVTDRMLEMFKKKKK